MGLQGSGEHVGTLGMRAAIIARSGLSLRVCLDEESAEIRYQAVYLACLPCPPAADRLVQWVGSACVAERHRSGEIDREVYPQAVWAQYVGYCPHLAEILCREHLGRCVDVVEHCGVDAYRGVGTGVRLNLRLVEAEPCEYALASISALYAPVEVVPVVQHTHLEAWLPRDNPLAVHAEGLAAQHVVGSV